MKVLSRVFKFLEGGADQFQRMCDSRKNNAGHLITTVVGVLLPPAVEVVLVPGDQVGAPAVRERSGKEIGIIPGVCNV